MDKGFYNFLQRGEISTNLVTLLPTGSISSFIYDWFNFQLL